ncbi:MAG TPA: helix-turn-helix domain-containing protein [Chitinophaga sp.]|uniref:AraC family transcriptional regulator n=1 Tax=Chitinophaga sp. TaxID=1869181 RepID=UPI002B850FB9|nr:helix-turn-helix domain-containing protein [Chitinophaga sp.]HVI46336.1 helix-turn-helix domain-containing protein [Chitinophaga sp.]
MKVLASHLNSFITYASVKNVPVDQLPVSIKMTPADFKVPAATVEMSDFYEVVSYISTVLQDEMLGIHVGNFVNLKHLGAVYELSLKATTVEEALHYCRMYLQKTFPVMQVDTEHEEDVVVIRLSIDSNKTAENRILLENTLTLMAREIVIITGSDCPVTTWSPYCGKGYPASWEKGTDFAVAFPKTILKAAVKRNGQWGLEVLIPEYLQIMESLDPVESFSNRVKLTMLSMATPALPGLDQIAYTLNLTPRTLQRRLTEERTKFRHLRDELTRKICDYLLRHDRYSIADVAVVLGYAEPAAFIHAFKKWYGAAPGKLREQII